MIYGIGTDVVSISRMSHWTEDSYALEYLYRESEQLYAVMSGHPVKRLACAFAVKESVMKALGTGWGDGVRWKDIEVLYEDGRISVRLYNRTGELCGNRRVFVSAHCTDATAVALAVITDGG